MIGYIESYDPITQTGVILSEEKSYPFHLDNWVAQVPPDIGDDVNFEIDGTNADKINLVGAYLKPPTAVKYKYVASALALLLGFAGIHRFYLGFYWIGLGQLAFTVATGGFGAVWGFIEFVLLVSGHINKDAKNRPLK